MTKKTRFFSWLGFSAKKNTALTKKKAEDDSDININIEKEISTSFTCIPPCKEALLSENKKENHTLIRHGITCPMDKKTDACVIYDVAIARGAEQQPVCSSENNPLGELELQKERSKLLEKKRQYRDDRFSLRGMDSALLNNYTTQSEEDTTTTRLSKIDRSTARKRCAKADPVLPLTTNIKKGSHAVFRSGKEKIFSESGSSGLFSRLRKSLVNTRKNLGSGLIGLLRGQKISNDLFEKLEEQLLVADVGIVTTRKIIDGLSSHAKRHRLKDAEALYAQLRVDMAAMLEHVERPLEATCKTAPFVILIVGVNGAGKTTTAGKLACQYQAKGKKIILAAGDTFRAAAVEQLQVWGERNCISVVSQKTGSDSASVIFEAIRVAKKRGSNILIADTAGRLQNKLHLMDELKKIVRVIKNLDAEAPHEIMLILDASTGQNALSQVNLFNAAVGLTGIVLTKLDGTAKGGIIFSVADRFGIPIRYIGIGEGIEDLRPFKSTDFIEALFSSRMEETASLNS